MALIEYDTYKQRLRDLGPELDKLSAALDLDSARQEIGKLQTCLRSYRTELLDVEIREDLQINIDEFLEFADWFFDGLFVDWAVQKKIEEAQERTSRVLDQIMQLQDQLHFLERELQEQSREQQEKIDQLVMA